MVIVSGCLSETDKTQDNTETYSDITAKIPMFDVESVDTSTPKPTEKVIKHIEPDTYSAVLKCFTIISSDTSIEDIQTVVSENNVLIDQSENKYAHYKTLTDNT